MSGCLYPFEPYPGATGKPRRKYLALIFGAKSGNPAAIPNRFDAERYKALLEFEARNEAITLESVCRTLGAQTGRWQDLPGPMRAAIKAEWIKRADEADDEHRRALMYPRLIDVSMSDLLKPFGESNENE